MPESKPVRCHCNACARQTQHNLLDQRSVSQDDDESGFEWTDTYDLLQCRGCESVTLRHSYADIADRHEVYFYPPRVSRRLPTWKWELPKDQRAVLDETYRALHNDARRLALMGARTLIDMVALDRVGDVGTFQDKLNRLEAGGFIAKRSREILESALDAGSAAAHRGYAPDADDLDSVMDIVENLLQSVYHLEKVAKRLKQTTPSRKKK